MTYTCPMHPEVISDQPGRCPKCGMALVDASTIKLRSSAPQASLKNYQPLIVVVLMIVLVSAVTSTNGIVPFSLEQFISQFMIGFFLVFSGFKLMDLKGFAEGYSTYDLLARRWFAYGYIYPFIELAFGLAMLCGYQPAWLFIAEILVMAFSGVGVAVKLARHERFQCACLGTFLKVPLTEVTLIEDFGMALLAVFLLLSR